MSKDREKPEPPKSEEEYNEARIRLKLSWAPETHKCRDCGWPTINGYCCTYCGSVSP